jgi:hypothetical protein
MERVRIPYFVSHVVLRFTRRMDFRHEFGRVTLSRRSFAAKGLCNEIQWSLTWR